LNPAKRAWLCTTLLGLLAGVAAAQTRPDSLYVRIGGEPKLTAIVNHFAASLWTDPQLAPFFEGVTRSRFEMHLAQQLCLLSGGGCAYEGDAMSEVHAGLKIHQADFYRVVEILRITLADQHVALRERNEMLALLGPMKRDVVER
jgi:hemoglobin